MQFKMNLGKFKNTIQIYLPDNKMKEISNRRLDEDSQEEGKGMCFSESVIRGGQN